MEHVPILMRTNIKQLISALSLSILRLEEKRSIERLSLHVFWKFVVNPIGNDIPLLSPRRDIPVLFRGSLLSSLRRDMGAVPAVYIILTSTISNQDVKE